MDEFISLNQRKIKRSIKNVEKYDTNLTSLSDWWSRISLIGKISSLAVASTILDDMQKTLRQFGDLQGKLIDNLIQEHVRKAISYDQSRSQMAIDVLIRNLFERTADIGFLATDTDVITFLKNSSGQTDDAFIRHHLQSYTEIYSVYDDALLLKPDGQIVFQLSQPGRSETVQDSFISQAINTPEDYVEYFGQSALINTPSSSLLYAHSVVDDGVVLGVIVLSFRFTNELQGIIGHLSSDNESSCFMLLDDSGHRLFTPKIHPNNLANKLTLNASPELMTMNGSPMVQICTQGQAYQDYQGPKGWHMSSLFSLESIEDEQSDKAELSHPALSELSALISKDLLTIRQQSIAINDDLQLIVLNGIITAARKNAVEFMPVLEAIKKIGTDIDSVFADSIESLFTTIISAQLEAIQLQASLAVDIMDRNLYERANDCRWWGLNTELQRLMSSPKPDQEKVAEILSTIHALYTVYHTLYVFDHNGHYLAFSDNQYNDKVGEVIEINSGGQAALKLKDIHQYTVSPFIPFECYDGHYTYIYNAAIQHAEQADTNVGGIGIVFDSTAEFSAILNDVLPRENGQIKEGSKALFTSKDGKIISTTSDDFVIGESFLPDIDKTKLDSENSLASFITLNDRIYIAAAAKSEGYREYKVEDGYINSVIAWVLLPCY